MPAKSGRVPPQNVARIAMVGGQAAVDVFPAKVGHFDESVLEREYINYAECCMQ